MTREKRGLDPTGGDGLPPDPKRLKVPALASVIVEALKEDGLQKQLCSSLEHFLRKFVREELESGLAKLDSARLIGRVSPNPTEGPDGRNLQLHFTTRLSRPLFTCREVEGEEQAAIHVVLLDANTGFIVTSGSESSAKLDVVVLEGDFNGEDDENWAEEDFESYVVKEREGRGPILTGDLQVSLKEGVGTLGRLTFTDNSSWVRSKEFRVGLKISSGFCEGVRIREAKTEAFTVIDHRGEAYKKHYPPSLEDKVWRLEKIRKNGPFHKRLNKNGVHTVKDFLRVYVRDPQRLRNIIGKGMSNKMWESLIEHVKTCTLSNKYYVLYSDETRDFGAIFNDICEFSGLIAASGFCSTDLLTNDLKVFADQLVKKAYDNWDLVIEYDGKALSGFKQRRKTMATQSEPQPASNYTASCDPQMVPAPSDQLLVETGVTARGDRGSLTRNTSHPQEVSSNINLQFENTPIAPINQFDGFPNFTQVEKNNIGPLVGPAQQSNSEFQSFGQSMEYLNPLHDWPPERDNWSDDFFAEYENMTNHEIPENEEMQQLHLLSMVGSSSTFPDDGYRFDEEQSYTSVKAVVGWLKIKAATRWGFYVRIKARVRKLAQLLEIED